MPTMIHTVNLTKRYGDLMALSNLNLEIESGQCFGFIGPNGAGKTTTIKILATLLKPTWGEARIDGLSVGPVHARQVRRAIGYVPDYFGSYDDMVVGEYLGFFASCYGLEGDQRKQTIGDVLDLTDLAHKADAEVNALSRGMQQRLSVARVLLHDPKVLLLDEPASGLDPRARIEMRELLKELHLMGKTILISSHILLELADLCDVFGIIEQGDLKFTGTLDELLYRARAQNIVHVAVGGDIAAAARLLGQMPFVESVERERDDLKVTLDAEADAASVTPQIASQLIGAGFALRRLDEERVNLETAFMRLTQGLVQ
ncbi:MAG: ABC transporter ATP-binding protein [Planctomycetota bacterium]